MLYAVRYSSLTHVEGHFRRSSRSRKKERLMWWPRPLVCTSACYLVRATTPFVEFELNPAEELFFLLSKCRLTGASFVQVISVTVLLYLRALNISTSPFHISWPPLVKFSIEDFHIILFWNREFGENRCSKGHTLLKRGNEVFLTASAFVFWFEYTR